MIDPRISLAATAPDTSQAVNLFNSALNASRNRDLAQSQEGRAAALAPFQLQQAEQSVQSNQATLDENSENRILRSVAEFGTKLKPVIESGNIDQAQTMLSERMIDLTNQGLPTDETVDAITALRTGDSQGVLSGIDAATQIAQGRGLLGGSGQKQFALQSNAPITDPNTGQVSTPVFNPATGQTDLVPVEGAFQETPTQKAKREFTSAEALSKLEVGETKAKATIQAVVARTSALKKEFSERRRLAARSTRKVKEAQKLAQQATQGVAGRGKLALARLFPGIDASNEGALTSAFKSLALDELQKFKGPTTDFEFAVTEDIAGSLGNSASANIARLASLERANWFADRESQQFNEHTKAGHDPDAFFFNFNETGLTKRIKDPVTGKEKALSYSLQDLQDTAVANHKSIDEIIKRLSR
jgi:hypothetical protein